MNLGTVSKSCRFSCCINEVTGYLLAPHLRPKPLAPHCGHEAIPAPAQARRKKNQNGGERCNRRADIFADAGEHLARQRRLVRACQEECDDDFIERRGERKQARRKSRLAITGNVMRKNVFTGFAPSDKLARTRLKAEALQGRGHRRHDKRHAERRMRENQPDIRIRRVRSGAKNRYMPTPTTTTGIDHRRNQDCHQQALAAEVGL